MLGTQLISQSDVPLVLAANVVSPAAILILCVIAGVGTLMLLPGRKPASARMLGGFLLAVGLIILALAEVFGTNGQSRPGIDGPFFWIFSIIAIFGAIRVVTHPRPVYSALYFILTVFASSGLFILLAADFLAAALVLIYAGAILITYVFVIMLAAQATAGGGGPAMLGLAEYDTTSREPLLAACVGFTLMGVLTFLIFDKAQDLTPPHPLDDSLRGQVVAPAAITGPTQALGEYLFRHQLINLELAGLILTLAMIGAIVISRRRIMESPGVVMVIEEVLGPATPIDDNPHSIPVVGTRNPSQKAYPET